MVRRLGASPRPRSIQPRVCLSVCQLIAIQPAIHRHINLAPTHRCADRDAPTHLSHRTACIHDACPPPHTGNAILARQTEDSDWTLSCIHIGSDAARCCRFRRKRLHIWPQNSAQPNSKWYIIPCPKVPQQCTNEEPTGHRSSCTWSNLHTCVTWKMTSNNYSLKWMVILQLTVAHHTHSTRLSMHEQQLMESHLPTSIVIVRHVLA